MLLNKSKFIPVIVLCIVLLCNINRLHAQLTYCASMPKFNYGRDIENVQFGALNHISNCSTFAPAPNSLLNQYSDYTSLPPTTFYRSKTYKISVSSNLCISTANTNSKVLTYIDYNQDGDFNDIGELVNISQTLPSSINPFSVGDSIKIPYTATLGNTRLRIVLKDNASADTCCGSYLTGETEDYTINIDSMPLYYNSSTAIQQSNAAAAGNVNVPILKIPVSVTNGGGFAVASAFEFNTIGTTNISDIVNAKVFFTGTRREFDATKLSAIIASPSSTMLFNVNDTLINSDTNFFWLAYDIANNTAINHVLDAQFTNLTLIGINQTPTNGNPLGSVLIDTAMTLLNITTTQSLYTKMYLGSTNNVILGIEINTSLTGVPIQLNSLNISTNGTSNLSVISNLKIWNTSNDRVFSPVNQFGNTIAVPNATQTIIGDVKLKPGTNYFWVTYDIVPQSQMNIFVDAECSSLVINNQISIPSITSPTGYGQTYGSYCYPVFYWNPTLDIDSIKFGNLSYNHFAGNRDYYTNNGVNHFIGLDDFTNLPPKTFLKGNNYPLDVTLFFTTYIQYAIAAYIDYNQDGDYDDVGEEIYNSNGILSPTNLVHCGNINIPYSAIDGKTHLRVICGWQPNNWNIGPCFSYNGEAWDFPIIISDPNIFAAYTGSYALQQTGVSTKGKTNVKILKIPITSSAGNGGAIATSFVLNTVGTSNTNDIAVAKLYTTGNNNEFNTSNLLATITSPSGAMVFSVNDTLLQYDTTFYWLTYDVSTNATINHVLDASFDWVVVNAIYQTPNITNPAGNVLIDTPMSILSLNTTQNLFTKVYTGIRNNKVIGVELQTSATGVTTELQNMLISTNGTTNLNDITNLKVWSTGNSPVFDTTKQFGSTIPLPLVANNVSGNLSLLHGINYFWVTYDISPTATLNNYIDAECLYVSVNNINYIPTTTAPVGKRQIRTYYCSSSATNTGTQEIYNFKFGSLNNSSTCTSIAPTPNSISQKYSDYTTLSAVTFIKGVSYPLSITTNSCAGFASEVVAVYVDYNQDGSFNGTGENIYTSTYALGSYQIKNAGNITIPITATNGETRLRVVYADSAVAPSCGNYQNGETEDYIVNIQDPAMYMWNQASSGDFTVASNWTPNRNVLATTDKLLFNLGGNILVSNVPNQNVSSITLSNNTTVKLSAASAVVLTMIDSLNLSAGNLINDTNVSIQLGTDTINIGTISGNGNVQGAELRRWVNKTNTIYNFPIYVGQYNRSVKITYTTAPITQGILMVKFVKSKPGNSGLPLTQGTIAVNKAGIDGYWSLTPSVLSAGIYKASVNADGFTSINDYTKLVLLKRNSSTNSWQLAGTQQNTTGSNSSPIVTRSSMNGFGNFGIGSDSLINPLPVTLLNLSATTNHENVWINWTTSSEINNAGFDVERSIDAKNFSKFAFVKGADNSSVVRNYVAIDSTIFSITNASVLYYRLKQTDRDGKFTYSHIVSAEMDKSTQEYDLKLYPNPFDNYINLSINSTKEQTINISVFDVLGKLVHTTSINANKAESIYKLNDLDKLSNGIYFFKIDMNNESKFVMMKR